MYLMPFPRNLHFRVFDRFVANVAFANLKEGEVVVDLGSGAGFDSLLAARRVLRLLPSFPCPFAFPFFVRKPLSASTLLKKSFPVYVLHELALTLRTAK
jgi:hypothetical protein